MDYLNELNPAQKEAVLHKDGPLLIVAGAGTGKTKTLTHRIFHLIKSGVSPENILAITFTNKAAKEMRERVRAMLEDDPTFKLSSSGFGIPFMSTFHSLGVHILKESGKHLNIPRHFTILDKDGSLSIIKAVVKAQGLDPKQFQPERMQWIISRQKADLITAQKYADKAGNQYFPQILASIWLEYEKELVKQKALDFDDLILKPVLLLKKHADICSYYQNKWQYVHIDEYQDTNTSQYELARMLIGKQKNICAVGDGDQCLLPDTKISTSTGEKKISSIKKGDEVKSASGNGDTCTAIVEKVKKRPYKGEIFEITTESGAVLKTTPEHIMFANWKLNSNVHFVYLMYRKDKGFRIGMVKGSRKTGRKNTRDDTQIGFVVRCNQEKADRMWVLKVCDTKQEAQYWEYFYSFSHGIPTVVFFTNGRKMTLGQNFINKLYDEIDTTRSVKNLFEKEELSFEYPHYIPQGTTENNSGRERINIRLVMFSDKRKSVAQPWGLSRVSINTTNKNLKNKLETSGFKTRKGKRNDWRLEIARLDYGEAERIAGELIKIDKNLILNRTALLTKEKRMMFLPAGSLRPSMNIAFYKKGVLTEDAIKKVEKKKYSGDVYDLNIKNTHNYIANDIAVHNCIYSWRGADFKNILNFEKDYPGAKLVTLEQNYRSTQTILAAANDIIKKNKIRKEKKLFTKNTEGEKISLFAAIDEGDEALFVARKAAELINEKVNPKDIAVLYRANFQSRALEEAFLSLNIPYQVLGVKFFDRKEIKDILAFVRAGLNPDNLHDVKRVINVPARGIGKVTLTKMFAGAEDTLTPAMKERVNNFRELLIQIKKTAFNKKTSELIKFVVKETGLEDALKKGTDDDKERLENIYELVTLASKYDVFPPEDGMEKLLADAALATDQDSLEKEQDAVKLMTVHASKGLEFPFVFITGLEGDLFPHKKMGEANVKESQEEEERRLFYVALTRAKQKLFLSYASFRTIFGSKQVNIPSEFLTDIDDVFLEMEEREEITTHYLD
jgi:DNA helicase-2/ATP-dependent DNA helicase PcrA